MHAARAWVRKERDGAERMIAASAAGAERAKNDDLRCASIECGEKGDLGVGGVLLLGQALNAHAARGELLNLARSERVEVTDDQMQRKAERCCGARAAIGANHQIGTLPAGPGNAERARVGLIATGKNDCAHVPSLSIARDSCVLPSPA